MNIERLYLSKTITYNLTLLKHAMDSIRRNLSVFLWMLSRIKTKGQRSTLPQVPKIDQEYILGQIASKSKQTDAICKVHASLL